MLTLVALVAWLAASVASAMPEGIMSSGNDSSLWNVTHTPIAGSNVNMSSYTDNAEERAIKVPEEFDSALKKWYQSQAPNKDLPEEAQKAKLAKLTSQIEAMYEGFSDLIRATENCKNLGTHIKDWEDSVRFHDNDLMKARKAMYVMLASHFQGDDLASVLVAGTKSNDAKAIAISLIDILVDEWVRLKKDPKTVFELFQLNQPGNPIENLLFSRWVTFVKSTDPKPMEKMLSVLDDHFKNDVALCSILVRGTKTPGVMKITTGLLVLQLKKLATIMTVDLRVIFELLELGDHLFESPLFPKWVDFLKLRFKNMYEEEMFKFLVHCYNPDDLVRAFIAGEKVLGLKQIAKGMLELQIKMWNDAELSDEEVFKLLGLQTTGHFLANPLFFTWVTYVKSRYPDNLEEEAMISALRGVYKDDDLRTVLATGKTIKGMEAFVTKLQEALNRVLREVWKRHYVDLGEPSSQKPQKVDLNEPPAKIDLNELPAETDSEPSRLKRQKSLDLNDPLPETEIDLNLPPRED